MSEKVNLKWTDEDKKNNLALKQNFYKINMMNMKASILGFLDNDLGTIEKLLDNLKTFQKQATQLTDPQMKEDFKSRYTEYQIYLQGIKDKVNAAQTYIRKCDLEVTGVKKVTKKGRPKKVKEDVK